MQRQFEISVLAMDTVVESGGHDTQFNEFVEYLPASHAVQAKLPTVAFTYPFKHNSHASAMG